MTPAEKTVKLLLKNKITFSTAESCTGGGIAQKITAVPGASVVFMGGIVAYDNRIKNKLLGVSAETLKNFGAVSRECAGEMVCGACRMLETEAAAAVTGIAGPGGGTPAKPVGLVYIAVRFRNTTVVQEYHFKGGREDVREATAEMALNMICELITKEIPQ